MTGNPASALDHAIAELLYRPLQVRALHLENRIAMAPMTRELSPGGLLPDGAPEYYARRARGGVGLIITEGTAIDHPVAHHNDRVPHIYGAAALTRWRAVVERVHVASGKIFPQLWHAGLYRHQSETANPQDINVSPSVVGKAATRPLSESDMADIIAAYACAARDARAVGFDGIAIHGAHGYLIDQFMWPRTNRRTDRYGGEIANRVRFGTEVIRAVRSAVGPDCPVLLRFSQWKGTFYGQELAQTPAELEAILGPFADAGVDIFDASMRRFWLPEFAGSDLNLAGWARKLTGRIAMAVGSVGLEGPLNGNRITEQAGAAASTENLQHLIAMMARGDFDLIAAGRILLANPSWPRLVREKRLDEARPYDPVRTARFLEPADSASD